VYTVGLGGKSSAVEGRAPQQVEIVAPILIVEEKKKTTEDKQEA
jgi:hypothetical protein